MPTVRTQEISNTDVFLYALYELGGADGPIDIEDVFLKMYEIAPARFRWRKHDLPNYKILHTAMTEAERSGKNLEGTLLGVGHVRRLSAKGITYVEVRLPLLRALSQGSVTAPPDKRPKQRAAAAVQRDPAYIRYLSGTREPLKRYELAILLRCTPDSDTKVWRERLENLRATATAGGRDELLEFVEWLEEAHLDVFGGAR